MAGMMKVRHISRMLLSPVIIVLIICLGVGLFIVGIPRLQGDKYSSGYRGPSAKINGVKIKDAEFNRMMAQVGQEYGQFYTSEQIKEDTLGNIIKAQVIEQAINKSKLKANKASVDHFMKMIEKQYSTPEEMKMLYQNVGVSNKSQLRKVVENQFKRVAFFADLGKKWGVEVTDEELNNFYEELEFAHILIATNERVKSPAYSEAEALKRANEAYEKIKDGTDFAAVVKEYTDEEIGKDRGGLLPRQSRIGFETGYDKDFVEAAFKLKVGEVSEPVKTQFGYHIIKLVDMKEAKGKEYEAYKEGFRTELMSQKVQSEKGEQLNKWLKDEVDKAKIEILDPALRAYRLKIESKWNESAEAYAKALKKKQNELNIDMYVSSAQVLKELKKYDDAINVLNSYPEIGRRDIRIQTELARIYDAKEDKDEAKKVLAQLSKRIGEEPMMQQRVLSVMKDLNYEDEAKALAEQIDRIVKKQQEQAQDEMELAE